MVPEALNLLSFPSTKAANKMWKLLSNTSMIPTQRRALAGTLTTLCHLLQFQKMVVKSTALIRSLNLLTVLCWQIFCDSSVASRLRNQRVVLKHDPHRSFYLFPLITALSEMMVCIQSLNWLWRLCSTDGTLRAGQATSPFVALSSAGL